MGRARLALLCGVAALGIAASFANAKGGTSAHAKKLRAAIRQALASAERDPTKTVRELEQALELARAAAKLEVRRVEVVGRPHTGLGLFEPLPGGEVPARHVQLYVEVANFAFAAESDGHSAAALEVEGDFYFEDGTPLGTQSLGTHRYRTRTPRGLTSFGLDVKLSEKTPPGEYRIDLIVRDTIGKKEARAPVVFKLH
jgi:hypothetical protein